MPVDGGWTDFHIQIDGFNPNVLFSSSSDEHLELHTIAETVWEASSHDDM